MKFHLNEEIRIVGNGPHSYKRGLFLGYLNEDEKQAYVKVKNDPEERIIETSDIRKQLRSSPPWCAIPKMTKAERDDWYDWDYKSYKWDDNDNGSPMRKYTAEEIRRIGGWKAEMCPLRALSKYVLEYPKMAMEHNEKMKRKRED